MLPSLPPVCPPDTVFMGCDLSGRVELLTPPRFTHLLTSSARYPRAATPPLTNNLRHIMAAAPPAEPVAIKAPVGVKKRAPHGKGAAADADKDPNALSEDDQRIKDEVALLITRAQDVDCDLALAALTQLASMLRSASGTVGAIPKPLKFARASYTPLKQFAATVASTSRVYRPLHDVLSFVSMTMDVPGCPLESLAMKLKGDTDNLSVWGHEYLRFLAGQIADAHGTATKGQPLHTDLAGFTSATALHLAQPIVAYMLQHQDESVACDLAIDIGAPDIIPASVKDAPIALRVVHYLRSVAAYTTAKESAALLDIVLQLSIQYQFWSQAVRVAIGQPNPSAAVARVIGACPDLVARVQLALVAGRMRCFAPTGDDSLDEIIGNGKLSELFRFAAHDLDCAAPKSVEDVLKEKLIDKAMAPTATTANSQNYLLANHFVNACTHAGYGKDLLLTLPDGQAKICEVKDNRMITSAALLGLVHLWDHEQGLAAVDRYTYSPDDAIKAGSLLATGILMSGVKSVFDPAIGLLEPHVREGSRDVRICAILGLGHAYVGTQNEQIKEMLAPIPADSESPVELRCMAALSLGYVFCGSADSDIASNLSIALLELDPVALCEPCVRWMVLALGLLFLGHRDAVDPVIEGTKLLHPSIQRYTEVVLTACGYAATGNVGAMQRLLSVISEREDVELRDAEKAKDTPTTADGAAAASTEPKPLGHKAVAVLGTGLIALGEELGCEMAKRSILHVLLSKEAPETSGRRGVPLALAFLATSNPQLSTVEALGKISHDTDQATAMAAILALGITAAGSNHARVSTMLRNLAGYYSRTDKEGQFVFLVRLAQGFTSLGKGHLTLSPVLYDRQLTSYPAICGLLTLGLCGLDLPNTVFAKQHYLVPGAIAMAASPRMLLTVDGDLKPVKVQVRVGAPIDTVTVVGKPKTISGFQTNNTPVLLQHTDRAELAPGRHVALSSVMEGIVVVLPKPVVEDTAVETS